ncbi:MAG: hypothetical protein AAB506_02505 [Patescibacteria group bacterium]
MLVLLSQKPTPEEFEKACEDFEDYVKFNLDLESNYFTIKYLGWWI